MRFKTYTGITWSVLELTGLLEDEDSHVYLEKFKKHIGLHPFHMTNLNAALNEILSSNLNSYDHDIRGFLLAYKNPKVLTPLGEVFYDTCFIHVDIEADFYIFRPEVGCTLKGIVNKKGLDHIGLLVHKAFNVSIPKPDDEEEWPGDNVEIGQEVRCVVKLLDFSGKLPFIRGVLNPDEYLRGCRLTPKSINSKRKNAEKSLNKVTEKNDKKHTYFATDSEGSSDDQEKKEVAQRKKSKRKSKQEEPMDNSDEPKEKRKKDKKRDKKVKEPNESTTRVKLETTYNSVNGETMSTEEIEESTSSGIGVKKKSRVRNSQGSIDNDGSESKIDPKNKVKTKIEVQSSQSSVDEDERNSTKHSSKKTSKTLSSLDSKNSISKIKFEPRSLDNDIEVTEENIVESKPEIRRSSLELHNVDSDNSLADFNKDKYITNQKTPKKIKRELFSDVDIHDLSDSVQETPKKRRKKDKLKSEISESELDRNIEESSVTKRSRKSNGLDFEHNRNIKIKKERVTSSSENIANEDVNSRAVEETEETTSSKKKSKKHSRIPLDTSRIKVEPGFEDVIVKVEPHDDYEEEIHAVEHTENVSKSSSKKRHQTHVDEVTDNNEIDVETNVERSKKKKKKGTDETELSNTDTSFRSPEKKKKRQNKRSSNMEESRESESGAESTFDFRKVKIKKERSGDS